jgi:arsenate reductase
MKILILCTGNSCRSQMAEGFLKAFDSNLHVFSAGTKPSKQVHPLAIEVMDELGVNIKSNKPKSSELFINDSFDYVITVCGDAQENCPVFNGKVKHKLHIGFDDPDKVKGDEVEILNEFRRIRNEILRDFFTFWNKLKLENNLL